MGSNFNQLSNIVTSKTYRNIQNIVGFSTLGLASVDIILENDFLSLRFPILNNSVLLLMNIFCNTFLGLNLFKNIVYPKNVKQIENLYHDFIIKYNQLNKVFGLNDPIEIYTMYYYLLCEGYLSVGKNFEFSNEGTQIDLLGAEVMRGKACCRHISALLANILNNYGIESGQLGLYSTDAHVNFLGQSKDIIERIIGNHAITFAVKDGKSYYLDPTNNKIYSKLVTGHAHVLAVRKFFQNLETIYCYV